MVVSRELMELIQDVTDENGYLKMPSTDRASKDSVASIRFMNPEDGNPPCIIVDVNLLEATIMGMHVYLIIEREKIEKEKEKDKWPEK